MARTHDFRVQLLDAIQGLRAFAIALAANGERADDLVQETLTKAWAHQDSFEPGSNMKAWLYTILRNEFYTQLRKKRREIEDVDAKYSSQLSVHPEQHGHLDMADMKIALQHLPFDQREALLLVGASGFSYEEAAEICKVAVGTIKSRVNRARMRLAEIMQVDQEPASEADTEQTSIASNQQRSAAVRR
jgi:RNA polymerase sigma-70 factor, ECF subfamily